MPIIDTDNARVIDLEHPRTASMPEFPTHRPGYAYTLYHRHGDAQDSGVRGSAFGQLHGTEHTGTHIDALSHQSECMTLHGGIPVSADNQTPTGFTDLGAEHLPPILTDGVLLDVASLKGVTSLDPHYEVGPDDLRACCDRQGVSVKSGSVVLVNLGNAHHWEDEQRYLDGPGMTSAASQWAIENRVLAVGADNIGWDLVGTWDQGLNCNMPGHVLLLVRAGIYIIENLDLRELTASGRSSFVFAALPLKLVGATASPIRPVAIVPK